MREPEKHPVALFQRPDDVIAVTGADRLKYLNDVTTQQLSEQMTGTRTNALVLDGNGVVQAAFAIAVLSDRVLLFSPTREVTTFIVDVLANRTFLLDVRFAPTQMAVWELRGDTFDDAARATNLSVRDGTVRPSGTNLVVCGISDGVEIVGEQAALDTIGAVLAESGVPFGSEDDREERRIVRGEPAFGHDIRPPHLPEEAGILPTHVHLAKGCYPGQEAVARMWMLGRPRRRLALLRLSDITDVGVFTGSGRDTVEITSAAKTQPYALGYVPERATVGDTFTNELGMSAHVERLIGQDLNPPGHDPAVTRRRDRTA